MSAIFAEYWPWFCIAIVLSGLYDWRTWKRLRRVVFSNLDSAYDNGYFKPGEYLFAMSAWELADDMVLNAADCEGMKPAKLVPHIHAWERKMGFRP